MWWRRFGLRSRPRNPDDFADEVRAHIEIEEARLLESGMSADDARREARRRFGNATLAVERVYEANRWRWLDALAQDVRFGLRLMRRSPAFTATAILVLSLGIGVNTALFSIVNALFFKPLVVERPEELFYLCDVNSNGRTWCVGTGQVLEALRAAGADDLAVFTAHWARPGRLSADDETDVVHGEWVETNYFDVLGVPPALGRGFRPDEDGLTNTEHPMVIGHDLWHRRFGGDASVLGRRVRVDATHFTIVGVMPVGFTGLTDPFRPAQFWVSNQYNSNGRRFGMGPVGRVKPGVTVAQVRAFVESRTPAIKDAQWRLLRPETRERFREVHERRRFPVVAATETRMPFEPDVELIPRSLLVGLTTVVGLVLLIATTNIAGLLMARGVTRTGEVAVRRALGAAGGRLARQLVTESALLAIFAGGVALVVAQNLLWLFAAVTPSRFALDVGLDWRVLLFALTVCLGAGVLVGLAPGLQAVKVNVLEALGAGIVGARQARGRLKHWIVVPQVGLSLVLLLVAGVHVRSLIQIEGTDLGYTLDDGLVVTIGRWEPYPTFGVGRTREESLAAQEREAAAVRQFTRNVLSRASAIPTVTQLGLASSLPIRSWNGELPPVMSRDASLSGSGAAAGAARVMVSPGYFDAMGIRVIRGRIFDDRDALYGERVALVSESLARRLWPNGDAIGKSLSVVPTEPNQAPEWHEVIGVVGDVNPVLNDARAQPTMYVSVLQHWRGNASHLVVRGVGDRSELVRQVKQAVVGADTFAEVTSVRTLEQAAGELLYPRRIAAGTLAGAGLVGLALASVGLYGVVSFSVSQRLRELGIRTTLGAGRRDIMLLVLKEGAMVAVIGCAIGFTLAVTALRFTVGLIPGLPLVDGVAFVVVPAILALVVLAACYLPARRAARVSPIEVLRGH